eukprot:TRINITY_DN23087_c0_g1_i1.p1 TRINITY_DN23087_c0_g1~~TRINITY_DN23087_c0_g1_i1.p1  ORF type:complete len:511 (-),score=81.89 TRINITY_DN23087_c0_g1_i1:307-1839(-)
MDEQPQAEGCESNSHKRKAVGDARGRCKVHANADSDAQGMHIPKAKVVPQSVLDNQPENILDELRKLRSAFSGDSITMASSRSVEPVLLFVDPHRLPGQAHFGVLANQDFHRGELIAEEKSCEGVDAVPLSQAEDSVEGPKHFKIIFKLNHSCSPNVIVHFVLVRGDHGPEATAIRYLAFRDILAGEELCKEYFDVCQTFQCRKRMLSFVCNCPVCNLPDRERHESDARREQIARMSQLEIGTAKTADEAYCLVCKIRSARQFLLLEKLGEGSVALKLSRLELELLQQVKTLPLPERTKLESLIGEPILTWEVTVQRENLLREERFSGGTTIQLQPSRLGERDDVRSDTETHEDDNENQGTQLSLHLAAVYRHLEVHLAEDDLESALAELVEVDAQCRRLGLDASILQALDRTMAAARGGDRGEPLAESTSVCCELDIDDDGDADPNLQRQTHAEILACMGNYFALFKMAIFAKRQYDAALEVEETNRSAQLGLARLVAESWTPRPCYND